MNTDIRNAEATTFDDRTASIELTLRIQDLKHLEKVVKSIRGVSGVHRRRAPDRGALSRRLTPLVGCRPSAGITEEDHLPKKHVTSADAPKPIGPYSQGVIAGGLLFVSGQIPHRPRHRRAGRRATSRRRPSRC